MGMSPLLLRPRTTKLNVLAIPGLATWHDASDEATVTVATGVSQWNDKSGNSRHATQSTANNQPSYASTRNGRRVLTYDGANDTMRTTVFALNQPSTMFVVANCTTNTNIIDGFLSTRAGVARRASGHWAIYAGIDLFDGTSDSAWNVLECETNGASSSLRVNGVQIISGNAGAQNCTGGLSFGSYNNTGSYMTGDMGEVITTNGILSASTLAAIRAYLKAKWGTP